MKIAVAGTGYVGLVTGVALANIGHNVTCVDLDDKKIEIMKNGISPIYEKDLEDLMKKNSERLNYTTDYKNAYKITIGTYIVINVGDEEYKYDILTGKKIEDSSIPVDSSEPGV